MALLNLNTKALERLLVHVPANGDDLDKGIRELVEDQLDWARERAAVESKGPLSADQLNILKDDLEEAILTKQPADIVENPISHDGEWFTKNGRGVGFNWRNQTTPLYELARIRGWEDEYFNTREADRYAAVRSVLARSSVKEVKATYR